MRAAKRANWIMEMSTKWIFKIYSRSVVWDYKMFGNLIYVFIIMFFFLLNAKATYLMSERELCLNCGWLERGFVSTDFRLKSDKLIKLNYYCFELFINDVNVINLYAQMLNTIFFSSLCLSLSPCHFLSFGVQQGNQSKMWENQNEKWSNFLAFVHRN